MHQVRYVVAVIDHNGFSRAADALGVTQPSLSQGVRALEAELGAPLFHRLGRRVALTPAGEAFAVPARQILRDAALARDAVSDVADLVSGVLELAALPTLAVDPLVALVGTFRVAHPGVRVRVIEPEQDVSIGDLIRTGRAEIGLADLPVRGDGLVTESLVTQDLLATWPPGTVLPRSRATIADLAAVPLITTPPGTSTRSLLDAAFAAAVLSPSVAVELTQRDAIAPLVVSGAGSSILPRALAEDAAAKGAVIAEFDPPITRTIGLVHRRGALSPAARAFVRVVLPGAGETPPPRQVAKRTAMKKP